MAASMKCWLPKAANISTKRASPAFNSEAGVRALDWFVNMYKAKAVPAGTTNYLWDDLGQGFASGTVAVNLDWPGWAGFFNDPEVVQGRRQCRREGSAGRIVRQAHRLVRSPRLLGHGSLRQQGSCRFACLVPDQRGQPEARIRRRPACRPAPQSGIGISKQAASDPYKKEVLTAFQEASKHAFPVPQTPSWIEISNAVYPELQAAILGDKTSKEALDAPPPRRRRSSRMQRKL
jgi:multiple sugar transport system substrate-binding protein